MQGPHGINPSWLSQRSRPQISASSKDCRQHGQSTKKDVSCTKLETARIAKNGTDRPNKKRSVSAPTIVMLVTEKPSLIKASPKAHIPQISRHHSWLSNISSKFSSNSANSQQPNKPVNNLGENTSKAYSGDSKKVTLSHTHKPTDNSPPKLLLPRNNQQGFLQNTLKRLSSSTNLCTANSKKTSQDTEFCKRMLLNVNQSRQRCEIKELNGNRLRRVAFCVDIEVSRCPIYIEGSQPSEEDDVKSDQESGEKSNEVNDNAYSSEDGKSNEGQNTTSSVVNTSSSSQNIPKQGEEAQHDEIALNEERLARKDKKRKLAQAYGSIPVEFIRKYSNASQISIKKRIESESTPSTDPVRIYRRCCQLREAPILKKISEQLACFSNQTRASGVIDKLDLSNYSLDLQDLITLGDYLAVVPVYELVLENCGLTDEGVRVILAGLLATKITRWENENLNLRNNNQVPQAGFVEKLVLRKNTNIGEDGWMFICTFITMCRSVKSIDLSHIPFPLTLSIPPASSSILAESESIKTEMSIILGKSIAGRLGGKELKILNLGYCGLNTDQIGNLVDGAIESGLCRLGLAGNKIRYEGLRHIARYIRQGQCIGLDLGDNDLSDHLSILSDVLDEKASLCALSLASCNLSLDSLGYLFPSLVKLENFEYIDLSQNTRLFDQEPSALSLLRRYLPKIQSLKRISLTSVSITPDQAIALAEILPELPNLAHINIMENHLLASLANSSAKNEAAQGEACALYASLMAATRASKTIVRVDIEVPSPDSSEIVKALAKQVVAYCLWNMDHESTAEISAGCQRFVEKDEAVLDALIHLVSHGEIDVDENSDPARVSMLENGYVISGTGFAKALEICLENRGNDARELIPICEGPLISNNDRAKDMSKYLLESAKRIRISLPSPSEKKSSVVDSKCSQKLQFLDETLGSLIKRFEDEFPETRHFSSNICMPLSPPISTKALDDLDELENLDIQGLDSDSEPAYLGKNPPKEDFHLRLSDGWHSSEILTATREEEGRIHRFGQKLKRDIPKPDHDETNEVNQKICPVKLELLRELVEGVGGEELKISILSEGSDSVLEELKAGVSTVCRQLQEEDPKAWAKILENSETVGHTLLTED